VLLARSPGINPGDGRRHDRSRGQATGVRQTKLIVLGAYGVSCRARACALRRHQAAIRPERLGSPASPLWGGEFGDEHHIRPFGESASRLESPRSGRVRARVSWARRRLAISGRAAGPWGEIGCRDSPRSRGCALLPSTLVGPCVQAFCLWLGHSLARASARSLGRRRAPRCWSPQIVWRPDISLPLCQFDRALTGGEVMSSLCRRCQASSIAGGHERSEKPAVSGATPVTSRRAHAWSSRGFLT
jgi:hypothetical protein